MSYHQGKSSARVSTPLVPYPTYPLPQVQVLSAEPAVQPPAPQPKMNPVMKALIVVLAISLALYLFDLLTQKEERAVKRNPGRKMSTREMAKKLYERLEKKGNINETTMRSLSQIGRSK